MSRFNPGRGLQFCRKILEFSSLESLNSLTPKAIAAAGLMLEDLLMVWIDDVLKEKTAKSS